MKSVIAEGRRHLLMIAGTMDFGRSLLDCKLMSHLWPVIAKIWGIFYILRQQNIDGGSA